MTNQTTTEAVKKILTVNGMLDLEQVDQIMQLIEQEKKAVLTEQSRYLSRFYMDIFKLPGETIDNQKGFIHKHIILEKIVKLIALANSQEEGEEK